MSELAVNEAYVSTVHEPAPLGPVSVALDRCTDTYNGKVNQWPWPRNIKTNEPLPNWASQEACAYIHQILIRDVPFQLHQFFGEEYWLRFCRAWADDPDFLWAMGQI